MSSLPKGLDILAQLQVKKAPVQREEVAIIVRRPAEAAPVKIRTKVVDKTREGFDRDAFVSKIKDFLVVGTGRPRAPAPAEQEQLPADVPEPEDDVVARPVPKKTGRRLKLVPKGELPKEGEAIMIKTRRRVKAPVVDTMPKTQLVIGKDNIVARLPRKVDPILVKASAYYLNNREIFINFMSSLFEPYKRELAKAAEEEVSCEPSGDGSFTIATHQKIVRDYLNEYTPYRGLLLYHGLGAGKTCASIGIAEAMKDTKRVIIMSPASLERNYYEELKKCGDLLYRKNQHWDFVQQSNESNPVLSSVLGLSPTFIKSAGGAWLVDLNKKPNFGLLNSRQKASLDKQLDEMIRHKYSFIAYNGLTSGRFARITQNGKINPFDNSVVIIDEAHNLISRIVNKLKKEDSISMKLYRYLLSAENARIVMLSGTPMINYPNELGIMYNILRGYIKTWILRLNVNQDRRVNVDFFKSLFKSTSVGGNVLDYIDYNPSSTTLTITRNPFGFVNKTSKGTYDGVRVGDRGQLSDEDFIGNVVRLLEGKKIKVIPGGTQVVLNTALPDNLEGFQHYFIDPKTAEVRNTNMFKRRILGLTSYFRSASEALLPRYEKSKDFHVVRIPMSDFQFGVYEEARSKERDRDRKNQRKKAKAKGKGEELYEEIASTYRIYSRAFCNFVFPKPHIRRPLPGGGDDLTEKEVEETADYDLEIATDAEKLSNPDGILDADDVEAAKGSTEDKGDYQERIQAALRQLDLQKEEYLSPEALETYSPKMLAILNNIEDPEHKGLHLVYSQFRTLEGIGIFQLVLEANGFARFKIKQMGGTWKLDIKPEDMGKPMYALYTGRESPEEKEVIRNVFNSSWRDIPTSLADELSAISSNNFFGEIVKVLMITASGAEGINLFNVRYVHIMDPYWHPARIEQIIGRARRICSHKNLPEEYRTVEAYIYLMVLSQRQMSSDDALELRTKDRSKIDNLTPITTDQALFELANMKAEISEQLLTAIKEASIDCDLHQRPGDKERLKCFSFGPVGPDKYAYAPNVAGEDADAVTGLHKKAVEWEAVELKVDGIKYALNKATGDVYDLESYLRARQSDGAIQPVQIGRLVEDRETRGYRLERI
jgi:hypothetical protein